MTPFQALLALLAIPYSADAGLLGHRDFRTRDTAHRRIEAAEVKAWPALLTARPRCPESVRRVDALSAAIPSWEDLAADALLKTDPPEEHQAALAAWFAEDRDRLWRLGEKLDAAGQLVPGIANARAWIEQTPYLKGSKEGDCLELIQRHRKSIKTPVVPKPMPQPAGGAQ